MKKKSTNFNDPVKLGLRILILITFVGILLYLIYLNQQIGYSEIVLIIAILVVLVEDRFQYIVIPGFLELRTDIEQIKKDIQILSMHQTQTTNFYATISTPLDSNSSVSLPDTSSPAPLISSSESPSNERESDEIKENSSN